MVAHQPAPAAGPPGPAPKRPMAVSAPSHEWIKEQAEAETRRRGRTFTQPEVVEGLIRHWKRTGGTWEEQ